MAKKQRIDLYVPEGIGNRLNRLTEQLQISKTSFLVYLITSYFECEGYNTWKITEYLKHKQLSDEIEEVDIDSLTEEQEIKFIDQLMAD